MVATFQPDPTAVLHRSESEAGAELTTPASVSATQSAGAEPRPLQLTEPQPTRAAVMTDPLPRRKHASRWKVLSARLDEILAKPHSPKPGQLINTTSSTPTMNHRLTSKSQR
jgi:hypothetical protein